MSVTAEVDKDQSSNAPVEEEGFADMAKKPLRAYLGPAIGSLLIAYNAYWLLAHTSESGHKHWVGTSMENTDFTADPRTWLDVPSHLVCNGLTEVFTGGNVEGPFQKQTPQGGPRIFSFVNQD